MKELEDDVAATFEAALLLACVPRDRSLFELGGYSITAATIAAELSDRYDIDVSALDLYDHPSVYALTQLIGERLA